MRILVVSPQPFFEERGTPIAVRLLVEELCALGHDVDLLVYHQGLDIPLPGVRIFRAGKPPGIGRVPIGISWKKLVCDLYLTVRLLALMRRNRYDVVHAVEEAVFPAVFFAGSGPTRIVYDMDSSLASQLLDKWRVMRPLGPLLRAVEHWAIRRSAAIFAVCEDLAARVNPWATGGGVFVLPDVPVGGNTDGRAVEDLQCIVRPNALVALYVGNLEHYQGIDLMLASFAKSKARRSLDLVVIGGEPEHVEHYRKRAVEIGLEHTVHFLGPRPVADLAAYLAQADVLVSPRILGENTPMKVYSYMQAGRAILATDIRSHTQALDPSCAALVPANIEHMARGFDELASDASRRVRLGEAARHKVEREYSIDAFRRRLAAGYDHIASLRVDGSA